MKTSVVGTGKLGGPLAVMLASKFDTVAVDLDPGIIGKWNTGVVPFEEPGLQERLDGNSPVFTTDFGAIAVTDITFVIVPTPTNRAGVFSSDFVLDAVRRIGEAIRSKDTRHTVVIVSTVMPGETFGPILRELESSSTKIIGPLLGLCYSPEFVALGDVFAGMEYPDMLLIGEADQESGDDLISVMSQVVCNNPPVARMSIINAEVTKISVNSYITMKSCFANNLGEICERLYGADAVVVTEAVGMDSRIGGKYLRPAVASGGPCLPRDLVAFGAMAERLGVSADLAKAAHRINERQAKRIVDRVLVMTKPGETVGVLGLSYKPGTYVTEASAGLKVAELLLEEGMDVISFDPMAKPTSVPLAGSFGQLVTESSTIVIMTPWDVFHDIEFPASKNVLDCWGCVDPKKVFGHLVRMGIGI